MKRIGILFVALLLLVPSGAAQTPGLPQEIALRYNAQISNAPAGTCGCFALQGGGLDANWKLMGLGKTPVALGLVADLNVVHTGAVSNADYGLTLSTYSFGPRVTLPAKKRVQVFGQALFGVAHGSGSQFPHGNSLVASANSFALDVGGGGDVQVNRLLSARVLQLDYLRTQLPNTTSNWQNNLRVGAGISFHFAK